MKKFRYIVYILLLSIILFGCEDFLKEAPISNINSESFFKNSQQFNEAVMAAYSNLQSFSLYQNIFSEMRSDNATMEDNYVSIGADEIYDIDKFREISNNYMLLNVWQILYNGIGKCNNVLYYVDTRGEGIDNIDQYRSEVLFLRAYYYYYLVLYWGDVPLVTQKTVSREQAFEQNKQVSRDVIFERIITDLNDAVENLPESYSGEDSGRVTKGAARLLLARLLMWQEQYGDAASELEKVINSGQFSLLDDYSSVFDINNENNKEIIFSVQYIKGPHGQYSSWMYYFLPCYYEGEYTTYSRDPQDGGRNSPTSDLLNSFEENDVRKSMIDTTFVSSGTGHYQDTIVPFTLKFMDPTHMLPYETGSNFPVFRYPHVLLMLAECYVRNGGGDPVPLVNQVRKRAGLPDLSNVTLDDIIHERRIEFHCEVDRWDVLVRTGKAIDVITAHGEDENEHRHGFSWGSGQVAFKNIRLLYPIPQDVLAEDDSMVQNPENL